MGPTNQVDIALHSDYNFVMAQKHQMVTKQCDAQLSLRVGEGGAATLDNKLRVAKVPPTFRPEIPTSEGSV